MATLPGNCSTCRYFTAQQAIATGGNQGICQRFPPNAGGKERYPVILNDTTDGCQEHTT